MIKTVIFDLDNTLYPTKKIYDGGMTQIYDFLTKEKIFLGTKEEFDRANLQSRKALEKKYGSRPLSQERMICFKYQLNLLDITYTTQLLYDIQQVYWEYVFENTRSEPGIEEVLSYLKSQSLSLAIISNGNTLTKLETLKRLQLLDYFDTIIGSDMLATGKPDALPYIELLHELKIAPQEAIYIGDNPIHDIQSANQQGIATIWFDRGEKQCPETICPNYTVHNSKELLKICKNLKKYFK